MANATEILALAARAEGAEAEEQREMILRAWAAVNPAPSIRVNRQPDGTPWPGDGIGPYTIDYTAWSARRRKLSAMLDAGAYESAAIMLIPEGWRLSRLEEDWRTGKWHAQLSERPTEGQLRAFDEGRTVGLNTAETGEDGAATAALAVDAAALRAIAAGEG